MSSRKNTFLCWAAICPVVLLWMSGFSQLAESDAHEPNGRTILAVGAHAGDMEVAAGAVLAKHAKLGDRVVLLHLTLGEGGNRRLSPQDYGEQKRREALAVARAIGAEVLFGPFMDGELPNDQTGRRFVVEVIRKVRPTHLIAHWARSIHQDHRAAHELATDAVLMASLPGVASESSAYSGIRGVYYTENWEDAEGFAPYLYVDVGDEFALWDESIQNYEFVGGKISPFQYLAYYRSLARLRGAEAGVHFAVAFDIEQAGKKRVLARLPD